MDFLKSFSIVPKDETNARTFKMKPTFNFLVAIAAIVVTTLVPVAGHIWYDIPITETIDVTRFGIGAIAFCYMLFKFKEH